ncbi:MAG: TadE family protein [Actinomycetota bacterium]
MRAGRNANGERGAAAVEFAIIMVVLLMVVFGIVEYGRIFSQIEVLESAAREGARVAAVQADAATIEQRVRDAASPFDSDINDGTFSISPGDDPPCNDDTGGEEIVVSFETNIDITLIPFIPPLETEREIQGTFRCEA